MKVSLSSTAEYSSKAAESIKDLKPNAADVLITSIVTSMVTDLGVVAPTSSGLLTFYDGTRIKHIQSMVISYLRKISKVMIMMNIG